MPTATRITKGMILNAAFEIARSEGIGKVSNREIAKKMNLTEKTIRNKKSIIKSKIKKMLGE